VANLPKVFKGTHIALDEIEAHRARDVVVRASRSFDVYADGEPITTLPATVKLVPGALRVIAPRA
jgi:diacylglycerol kinase family enzyme